MARLGRAGQQQADDVAPTYTRMLWRIAAACSCPLQNYTHNTDNDNAIVHIGPALGPPELRLSPVRCWQQLAGRRRQRGRQGKVLDFLV